MEILHMTFGGITVGTWLVIAAVWFGVVAAYREWASHRRDVKEIDAAWKGFKEKYRWVPKVINGIDCGEWVRKDGKPVEYNVKRHLLIANIIPDTATRTDQIFFWG
jgi:hypothetical protein